MSYVPPAANPALLAYLKTRRSIPVLQLTAPAPEGAVLDDILKIGARVPDHGKLAPWRFILYRGAGAVAAGEKLAALKLAREPGLADQLVTLERTRFTRAPLVIGVISRAGPHVKIPVWEQELSAGAVCLNLLHAIFASGFAGIWLSEWPVFDAEASALLGAKEGERFAGFLHVGTPTEPPFERERPDMTKIVTEFEG